MSDLSACPLEAEPTLLNLDAERTALLAMLRAKNIRLTPQRERVLDIFLALPEGEHLSAEDLHMALRGEQSDISLATSYRTLKLLAELGVLREVTFGEDRSHYELCRGEEHPHHHLICSECGMTEEFESPALLQTVEAEALSRQFSVSNFEVKLYVACLLTKTNCPKRLKP
jgi:Fur family ferric uptake transcriptional regulator